MVLIREDVKPSDPGQKPSTRQKPIENPSVEKTLLLVFKPQSKNPVGFNILVDKGGEIPAVVVADDLESS